MPRLTLKEKNFIEKFEAKVRKTIEDYGLVSRQDKILAAVSGGKDSTAVLYLLKKFGFNIEAIHLNLLLGDYSRKNLENLKAFCKELGVKLHEVDYRKEIGCSVCFLRSALQEKEKTKNCAVCGVLKKYFLNKKARELKAGKIATGHNLDDEAQTFLLNFVKGTLFLSASAGPISGLTVDRKFVPRIKPLYFISEEETRKYSELKKFPVIYQRCPCGVNAFRSDFRRILNESAGVNPKARENLISNLESVQPFLKEKILKSGNITYCRRCSEPSRNETCKACTLLLKARA